MLCVAVCCSWWVVVLLFVFCCLRCVVGGCSCLRFVVCCLLFVVRSCMLSVFGGRWMMLDVLWMYSGCILVVFRGLLFVVWCLVCVRSLFVVHCLWFVASRL